MRHTVSASFAAASLAMALVGQALLPVLRCPSVPSAHAAERPRYGGTLRLHIMGKVRSLNPRERPQEWSEAIPWLKLASLAFEPLVGFDENGRLRPVLATAWTSDADHKRWQFRLRPGVKFHDGTPLTAGLVAEALRQDSGGWKVGTFGDTVLIEIGESVPNFPATLWLDFISKPSADGSPVGTGPFRLSEWHAGESTVVVANEDHWAGRPYLDSIEVRMGGSPRERQIDFELGRADVVELAVDQIRAAPGGEKRIWSSAPVLFYVLGVTIPPQFREALSLVIDRPAIHTVLLQKQGEPAGSCLPQWLSGYSWLFPAGRDVARARQLLREGGSIPKSFILEFDANDPVAHAIAERIAVDAREIGITFAVSPRPENAPEHRPDAALFRRHVGVPDPGIAMESDCPSTHWGTAGLDDLQLLYRLESEPHEQTPFVPIAFVPENYGLSNRVRGWAPTRWGQWNLADVWLAPEEKKEGGATR